MMTTAELASYPEILPYLEALERKLGDLPEDERVDLLRDLGSHFEEILTDESETSLADRIGTPDAYADEFAASIGLDDVPEPTRPLPDVLSDVLRRLDEHRMTERVRRIWIEMRPAWWTIRGAAIGLLLAWNWLFPSDPDIMAPARLLTGAIVLGVIGASMRIGHNRDRNRGWRWLSYAATVAGLLAALALMANLSARMTTSYYINDTYGPYLEHLADLEQEYLIENGPYSPITTTLPHSELAPIVSP